MAQTRGFYTGGTIHIVVNNQIGFTTSDPRDTRGTIYCTDIAKMAEAPILHVNGDDPEVCLLAIEIALDYRQQFHRDVFIDLVCFRRLGHNEADEPMVTQPLMYKKIAQHPGTRKLYADKLVAAGVVAAGRARGDDRYVPQRGGQGAPHQHDHPVQLQACRTRSTGRRSRAADWTESYEAHVPLKTLKALSKRLAQIPEGFKLHPRVERVVADRKAMGEGKLPLDWGMGETLAYATLLNDGYGVRISGQDVGRGTFAHRHAVLHDQNREKWDSGTWIPLEHVKDDPAGVRDHRFGADRERGAGLRVRLHDVQSPAARGLGGAVRRLRQRRAGRHRPVHRVGRSEVGPHLQPRHAAPARLRRAGPRALVRAARALSAALRRAQHAGLRTVDARADLPLAAPADASSLPAAADRHEPEEPAAAQGGRVVARGARGREVPERDRRSRGDSRRRT